MSSAVFSNALRAFALTSLLVPMAASAASTKPAPWNIPFNNDSVATANAATALEAEEDVVILIRDLHYRFDEQGRKTLTERWVYRVNSAAAVADWAEVSVGWAPWFQDKPEVRARVISPNGTVHVLDPKTIDDAPAADQDGNIYSDSRVLQGPLPAVAAGSVVEHETITRDREPLFAAGISDVVFFTDGTRTEVARLTIEYPEKLGLRHVSRLAGQPQPKRSVSNGIVKLVFEQSQKAEVDDFEPNAPRTAYQWPYVSFSTGASWRDIATRYSKIVDEQIASSDFTAEVKKIVGSATDRRQIAEKLLAELHRNVRYTGVEFGEASIVPRTPAETLTRKYGDCKDQAAYLTAMLRAAGVPANVALLRVGSTFDVEEELPGFGLFNHAIVVIPGNPSIWIDPTDEYARAGELPLSDQSRLALIASPESRGLTLTPKETSAKNRIVHVREFKMRELGPSQVVETITAYGSWDSSFRHYYTGDAKSVREAIEEYVKPQFLAKELTKYSLVEPTDLSKPFELRVEMDKATRGTTTMIDAAVVLFPASLFERMPYGLTAPDEEEEEGEEKKPRHHDFIIDQPHVVEWRYIIHPPEGFEAPVLPDDVSVEFGQGGKLTGHFSKNEQGTIIGEYRFDSGADRLTAAQAESTRLAIREIAEQNATIVRLLPRAQILAEAGKVRESFDEYRRLVALHPKEAVHRAQFALALLDAGLGERAREEAKKAMQVEPKAAVGPRTYGWVMQHDLFGRRFQPGFDRDAAIAAYRKAKELDPDDTTTRADLAILLEHDKKGVRYSASASLKEAVAEYRELRKQSKEEDYNDNLIIALIRTGDSALLREAVKELPDTPLKSAALVVAARRTSGLKQALDTATRLGSSSDQKRAILSAAAGHLLQMRLYPEALSLMEEALKGSGNAAEAAARLTLLRNLKKHEELTMPQDDPATVVKKLFITAITQPEFDPAVAAPFFARRLRSGLKESDSGLLQEKIRSTSAGDESVDMNMILDFGLGVLVMKVDGNDAVGYRVTPTSDFAKSNDEAMYVVKEEGDFRIAAMEKIRASIGFEALHRLDSGDLDAARKWLDWAREGVEGENSDEPFSEIPLSRLWKIGAPATADQIRVAAATLLAESNHDDFAENAPQKSVEMLLASRKTATPEQQLAIDHALALAYEKLEKNDELIEAADSLLRVHPHSTAVFELAERALMRKGAYGEVETRARQRLADKPKDLAALRVLAEMAADMGEYAKGLSYMDEVLASPKATAVDFQRAAWLQISAANVTEKTLEYSQKAVTMTSSTDSASLATRAAVFAELGRVREARESLVAAMEHAGRHEPTALDWYVAGRIAETVNEKPTAVAAYRKAEKARRDDEDTASALLLEKRLKAVAAKR